MSGREYWWVPKTSMIAWEITLYCESYIEKKAVVNVKAGIKHLVAERTSYFCLARKLISSHIFTQWGWIILFTQDHFPRQHKNGESPPNYHFLRTFWEGWTYFLSATCIAPESQHYEESRLIYGPFESTQGFPVEHKLDACNPPLTGTPLCHL